MRKPLEPIMRPFGRAYGIVSAVLLVAAIVGSIIQALRTGHWPWGWIVLGLMVLLVAYIWSAYDFKSQRDSAQDDIAAIREARSLAVKEPAYHVHVNPNPGQSEVQFGVKMQNHGDTVVGWRVERMSVVIENRTTTSPDYASQPDEFVHPGDDTDCLYPGIGPLDVTQELNGKMEIVVRYGHPDLGLVRRLYEERSFTLYISVGSSFVDTPMWTIEESWDRLIEQ